MTVHDEEAVACPAVDGFSHRGYCFVLIRDSDDIALTDGVRVRGAVTESK